MLDWSLADGAATRAVARRSTAADAELQPRIDELRELAHGIIPPCSADEGLAAALETLADARRCRSRLGALPDERFAGPVETAGYVLVDEVLRLAARRGDGRRSAWPRAATATCSRSRSATTRALRRRAAAELVEVADASARSTARLTAHASDAAARSLRAELPCA